MKKNIKYIIIVIVILAIVYFVFNVFKEVTPYDDTKKLYIRCNSIHHSYAVLTGDNISFAEKSDDCKIDFEIRNVDRNFIKLKASSYFYQMDSNNEIDNLTISNDIYISPDKKLILYSKDKNIKFEFEYK